MDEKEVLANAAAELTREGDIDEVRGELTGERAAAFPTLLFIANVIKDIVDFPVDLTSPSGFTWFFYVVLIAIPVWFGNIFYMWGKVSWLQKRAIGGGTKFLLRRYKRRILRRLVLMGLTSLAPFVNMLFPQCLFVILAHNSHKKMVAKLLEMVEIFATAARTGDYRLAAEAAGSYAAALTQNIVRAANVSGRAGDMFGDRARAGAQRLEGNIVREARGAGGRATMVAAREQRQEQQASRVKRQEARRIASTPSGGGNSAAPAARRVP